MLALTLPCSQQLELPGTVGHRARMRLALFYMSPSAFKTWFCDLPIHYVKSSKNLQSFSAREQRYERFSSLFF